MYENKEKPVATEFLTIKDIVEIVGTEPLRMEWCNKWVVLVFPFCNFRIKAK